MPISDDAAHLLNAIFEAVHTLWPDFIHTCAQASLQSAGHDNVHPSYATDTSCPISPRLRAPHTSPLRRINWVANSSHYLNATANGVFRRTCDPNSAVFHNYGGRPTANKQPWIPAHWRNGFFTRHTTIHPLSILHFTIRIERTIGRKPHQSWTLDRINVNNGYGNISNLRWASDATQQSNKQKSPKPDLPDHTILFKLLPRHDDRRTWKRIARDIFTHIDQLPPNHEQYTLVRMLNIHRPDDHK